MSKSEMTWQALHTIDVLQTVNGPANDDCFTESDGLTRQLIGEQPHQDAVIAWGVGMSILHLGATKALEHYDAPRWSQIGWQAVTLVNTTYSVANNHRNGIRPYGDNNRPQPLNEACRL